VSELRADFARQAASDDPTKSRRRKVSDLREELSRQASDEQARNRRRKASELREAFARRAEIKEGRQQEERRRREKSQEGPSPLSLYRVLGVDDEASDKEIRKAFLEKVRECHPDRHTEAEVEHLERMETRMKEVTSAYSVLSDAQSRAEYDKARRIRTWVGASSNHNSESSPNQSFKASKDEDDANFDYKGIFRFLFGGIQAIIFQQSK